MNAPETLNDDQAAYWNADAGRTWVELQHQLDRLFAPVGARVVEAGFPGEGGRAVDIGCGAGATTLAMARRLGPAGRCLGVDISRPLVEAAADRARAEGLSAAAFLEGDAQSHRFPDASFDAAVSRFGVMFFSDPVAAFANIRRALRPDGRLAFAAWRRAADNPFMTAATGAAAPFLPALRPPEPDAPGQFGFARADRVRAILADAGWRQVEVEALDVGGEIPEDDLLAYVTRMGPVGQALSSLAPAERTQVAQAVVDAFAPFVSDGAARFTMACWLVTARA